MEVTPHSGYEGEIITLSCTGNTVPLKATAQLVPNLSIEWVGPTGTILTNESDLTVSTQHRSVHGVVRALTISGTKYSNTGVYSCVATLSGIDSRPTDYHLAVKSRARGCNSVISLYFVCRKYNYI